MTNNYKLVGTSYKVTKLVSETCNSQMRKQKYMIILGSGNVKINQGSKYVTVIFFMHLKI